MTEPSETTETQSIDDNNVADSQNTQERPIYYVILLLMVAILTPITLSSISLGLIYWSNLTLWWFTFGYFGGSIFLFFMIFGFIPRLFTIYVLAYHKRYGVKRSNAYLAAPLIELSVIIPFNIAYNVLSVSMYTPYLVIVFPVPVVSLIFLISKGTIQLMTKRSSREETENEGSKT